MKEEWNALKTLALSSIFGAFLMVLMFISGGMNTKEYLRDAKLADGSEADWRDKAAAVLYSPGELHVAHFKSEINCQHCHSPAKKVDDEYCISCHPADDFKTNTNKEVLRDAHITIIKEMSCFACHTEHQGLGGRISVTLDLNGHRTKLKHELQEDCKQCHISDYERAHPNMINEKCVVCHKLEKTFSFKTHTFRHTDVKGLQINVYSTDFVKLPYPEQGQCEECHKIKFHVGEMGRNRQLPSSVDGAFDCLSCHNLKKM